MFWKAYPDPAYVRLTNGEYSYFGLVCPSCQKITLKKYPSAAFETLDSCANTPKAFVLFAAEDSLKSEADDESDGKGRFRLPETIPELVLRPEMDWKPARSYPKWFKSQCLCEFSEKDIKLAVEYENRNRKKIFPRIVGESSVYSKLDGFLLCLDGAWADEEIPEEISRYFSVHYPEFPAMSMNNILNPVADRKEYFCGAQTNISKEEYKDYAVDFIIRWRGIRRNV